MLTSDPFFRALMETSNEVITLVDARGTVLYVSPNIERVMGYTVEEHTGSNAMELIHPDDRPRIDALFRRLLSRPGSAVSGEMRYRHRDGSMRWIEARGVNRLADPGLAAVLTSFRDVTARKRAEEALRDSEQRFRVFMDNCPAIAVIKDARGRFVYGNQTWADLFGRRPEELLGKTDFDLWPEADAREVAETDRAVLAGQKGREYIRVAHWPDGGTRRLHVVKFPLEGPGGEPLVGAISLDVTGQRQAEESLARNYALLRAVLESTDDTIFVKDRDGRYLLINRAGATLMGRTPEGVLGKHVRELFDAETAAAILADDRRVMDAGEGETFEQTLPLPGGPHTLLTTKSPYRGPDGEVLGVVGISRDITERKRAEDDLLASLREKEALLKEVHHRVKNNLQIVTSLLNLQAARVSDPAVLTVFTEMRDRIRSMGLLHEALYRSESLARLDVREYVAALCAHLFRSYGVDPQRVALRKEVADISLDIDRAIPCGLIITELVSNALKYAFPGGRGGTLTVGLRAGADGGCALTVADDGGRWPAGLDFRAARTLGLRLVCDLTGQLGGEVRLDAEGRTAFTITFTP